MLEAVDGAVDLEHARRQCREQPFVEAGPQQTDESAAVLPHHFLGEFDPEGGTYARNEEVIVRTDRGLEFVDRPGGDATTAVDALDRPRVAAIAAVAIVALRFARISISFPVPHSLMLEGIGWLAVLGVLLKRFFRPENLGIAGVFEGGFWLALVAAVAVAMLASRLSKDIPVVVLPGWFKGSAGAVGAAILVASLGAGVAFGLTNSVQKAREAHQQQGMRGTLDDNTSARQEEGLPACAEEARFPVPAGVEAVRGVSMDAPTAFCSAELQSELPLRQVIDRYRAALREAGWTIQALPDQAPGVRLFLITEPECGTLVISGRNDEPHREVKMFIGEQQCDLVRQQEQLQRQSPGPN